MDIEKCIAEIEGLKPVMRQIELDDFDIGRLQGINWAIEVIRRHSAQEHPLVAELHKLQRRWENVGAFGWSNELEEVIAKCAEEKSI